MINKNKLGLKFSVFVFKGTVKPTPASNGSTCPSNSFLNKISTCFLTAINVQYGGDRYTAHAAASNHMGASGSPPTKTILTMEFQELETITRERISEGY